ncbi:MAG TPA: hypothetical protein ENJ37_05455 [Deltaproteobacteria bacterium]|nr:hypothetical protein [Deltaproteobacteria bacterium]
METFFKVLAGFVHERSKVIVAACAAVGLVCLVLVLRMELRTDMLDVLPSDDPATEALRGFLDTFGAGDNLIVVVERSDGAAVTADLEAVDDLAARIRATGLVEFVDFRVHGSASLVMEAFPLFLDEKGLDELERRISAEGVRRRIAGNRRRLLSPLATPADFELMRRDPLGLLDLAASRLMEDVPYGRTGYYTTKDGGAALIIVRPLSSARDLAFLSRFDETMATVARDFEADHGGLLKVGLAGPLALAMEARRTLGGEVTAAFVSTAAAVFLLFQFVYRKRLLMLVLTAAALALALLATLAAAYLLFGGLNIVSSVVAAMLMGLGIDYAIHLCNRVEEEYARAGDVRAAMERAWPAVLPAVATGAATTALAFSTIVLTSFRGLHELGLVAAIGVAAAFLSTVFFLGAAIAIAGPAALSPRRPAAGRGRLLRLVKDRPLSALLAAFLLTAASAVTAGSVRFDSRAAQLGMEGSEAARLEERLSATLAQRRNPLLVAVAAASPSELLARYDRVESTLDRLASDGAIGGFSSLRTFLPPLSRQLRAIERLGEMDAATIGARLLAALEAEGFEPDPYYGEYAARLAGALSRRAPLTFGDLEKLGEKRSALFYNKERAAAAAYVYPVDGRWREDRLAEAAGALSALEGVTVTGGPVILRELRGAVIGESVMASAAAFSAVVLILALRFGGLRRAVLVLAPLAAGALWTAGLMGLAGVDFNFINVGAAPLVFGIGVDYGIYMVRGWDEGGEEGLASAGRSVLMCAATSVAGFASLTALSFKGLASLGTVIVMGIGASMAAALLVVPAAAALMDKRQGDRVPTR